MTEFEEYKQTGIIGGYDPAHAVVRQLENEKVSITFRDTLYWKREGCSVHERDMYVDDRLFHITSVFPDEPTATPTEKMLRLIDAVLEKESYLG